MASYPEITRVFAHDTNNELETCVGVWADNQDLIDLIVNFNPELTVQDLINVLDGERIEYEVYTRPKRRPRN